MTHSPRIELAAWAGAAKARATGMRPAASFAGVIIVMVKVLSLYPKVPVSAYRLSAFANESLVTPI